MKSEKVCSVQFQAVVLFQIFWALLSVKPGGVILASVVCRASEI